MKYPRLAQPKSRWLRFRVKLFGSKFVRWDMLMPGKKHMKIYLVYCSRHKCFFEAYPSGYDGWLDCPKCNKERFTY